MLISSQHKSFSCLFVFALMVGATSSAFAQSNIESSGMLGVTARQMLSEQPLYVPDFVVRAPYAGLGIGRSTLSPDTSRLPDLDVEKGEQTGVQLTLGMDFGEFLAAELHVADLGKAELSDGSSVAYREFGVSALLYLGNNRHRFNRRGWNVFGRAGLGYLPDGVSGGAGYEQTESGQWILGAGTEYSTKDGLGFRAEGVVYDSDVRYLQLGVLYRFAKLPGGVSGIADLGVSAAIRAETARLEAARKAEADAVKLSQVPRPQASITRFESVAQTTIPSADVPVEASLSQTPSSQTTQADTARAETALAQIPQSEIAGIERARAETALQTDTPRTETEARTEAARADTAARAELAREALARAEESRLALAEEALRRSEEESRAQLLAQEALDRAEESKAQLAREELAKAEAARAQLEADALAQAKASRKEREQERVELARVEAERVEAALAQKLAREKAEQAKEIASVSDPKNNVPALPDSEADQLIESDSKCSGQDRSSANGGRDCVVLNGVIDRLKFLPGSYELPFDAREILDAVAATLRNAPQKKARLNIHTDNVGGAEANMQLSQQRARVIARYLIQQGVPKTMLQARAYGDKRPVDTNETAGGRYNNGRVEIFLVD